MSTRLKIKKIAKVGVIVLFIIFCYLIGYYFGANIIKQC